MRTRVSLVLAHSAPLYIMMPQGWGPEWLSDLPMITKPVTGTAAYKCGTLLRPQSS